MSIIIDNITSEGYLSGNTLFATSATLTNLVVTNITGASTTDYYVTGGTYSASTLTLKRNGISDVIITGFTSGGGGSGTLTGSGLTDKVAFWSGASGLTFNTNFHWDSINERLGVGFASPSAKVHINNTGVTNSFLVEDSANPDNTPFVINQSGQVGIGATSPLTPLHVGIGTIDNISLVTLQSQWANDNGKTGSIDWRDTIDIVGSIDTRYDGSTIDLHIGSLYNLGYNSTTRMIIKGNGNVGIGITSPSQKLHVSGNTIVSGSISGASITITSIPTLNNTNTQILTRNSTNGSIEYSTAASTAFYPYGIGFAQSIGNYLT